MTEIVTSDTSLMERVFRLDTFINASANHVIDAVEAVNMVVDTLKLSEYLQRGGGNRKYARRMMRIRNSKVFDLTADDLREKLTTVNRWKGKFQLNEEGKIILSTYKNVEDLIDLFDERFVRSEVTGQEYDTDVKSLAEDVEESV